MRFKPQRASSHSWINSGIPPPCDFIAVAVNLAMVPSTQWDGELIADLAPECRALRQIGGGGNRRVVGRKSDKAAWRRT